jgi:hypothetical protein
MWLVMIILVVILDGAVLFSGGYGIAIRRWVVSKDGAMLPELINTRKGPLIADGLRLRGARFAD